MWKKILLLFWGNVRRLWFFRNEFRRHQCYVIWEWVDNLLCYYHSIEDMFLYKLFDIYVTMNIQHQFTASISFFVTFSLVFLWWNFLNEFWFRVPVEEAFVSLTIGESCTTNSNILNQSKISNLMPHSLFVENTRLFVVIWFDTTHIMRITSQQFGNQIVQCSL